MKLKILLLAILAFCSLTAFQCDDELPETHEGYVLVTLRDYTGFDGCGLILEISKNERLEPVNLDEFNIDLKEGKRYFVKYETLYDMASICMVGEIVNIVDIIDTAKE